MQSSAEPFQQAEQYWNLDRLYRDLTIAKQQYCGKARRLTPLEKSCLRGLLCGCNPPEIATELNREPRGLRVDLSRGLYRYVEVLAGRKTKELNDWRDIAIWLSEYQTSTHTASDSTIKIVDISLAGNAYRPILDVKVRNIGREVAFLKRARFDFQKIWTLYSWIPQLTAQKHQRRVSVPPPMSSPAEAFERSRAVEPSYDYEFDLELEELQAQFNALDSTPIPTCSVSEDFNISQCVACNDVDRFTLSLTFPSDISHTCEFGFLTHVYQLCIDIIYDEDDKIARSQNLLLAIESEDFPALRNRVFVYTPEHIDTHNLKHYSSQNQAILKEIAAVGGQQNKTLQAISRKTLRR